MEHHGLKGSEHDALNQNFCREPHEQYPDTVNLMSGDVDRPERGEDGYDVFLDRVIKQNFEL